MCYQGSETGQEEEDKARNKDSAESCWRSQHRCLVGRGQRQPGGCRLLI